MNDSQPITPTPVAAYSPGTISRVAALRRRLAPTGNTGDAVFRALLGASAVLLLVVVVMLIAVMWWNSRLSIAAFGWGFLTSREWNPGREIYGALPYVYGTLASSLLALLISVPLSLGVAVFLTEQAPRRIARPVTFLVELLAAIPSVVYGLWGIFVLAPFLRENIAPIFSTTLGWSPFFSGSLRGGSLLTGGIILAIMITPIITAIVRDVLSVVPVAQREAALALGATRWETSRVVLANGAAGIAGAIILGLGRAVGETMAVTMVIGNRAEISLSVFDPSYSIAAVLANEFREATTDLHRSSLVELGLILLFVTILINGAARLLVWSVKEK
ncbi:MAG: phosphate ABC transporter permease subunit PstC [Pyrinomonadaceae bacterium MAG19_C2-C3]|nr:phosphate ABC transporter permease subunit PstC [Pyrinomonadaceae bacterium MAG19_C2-C3]